MNGKLTFQAKVGALIFASLVGLGIIATTIEPLKFHRGAVKGTYYFRFSNVGGLEKEAPVRVAGVTVGKVSKITVSDSGAVVEVSMLKDIKLHKDASAKIETMGLMGEKYVEVNPGSPEKPLLQPGEVVLKTETPVSTDQLVSELYRTVEKFNQALITKNGENRLSKIMDNISKLTENVNSLMEENRNNLRETLKNTVAITEFLKNELPKIAENVNTLATQFGQIALENREDIRTIVKNINEATKKAPEIADRLDKLAQNLSELLNDENRENLSETIENMKETTKELKVLVSKVNNGNGTVGKLFNDETLYSNLSNVTETFNKVVNKFERLQTYVGFSGDVNTRTGDTRGVFTFQIIPSPTHYYLLELVGDSQGKVERKKYYLSDGSSREEIEKNYRTEFTVQYARVFNDSWLHKGGKWILRGGLKESTGGIGLDYVYNNKLSFISDIWDAGREEADGDNIPPHLRVGIRYRFNRNWFVYLGGDELLYSKHRGPFFGLGVLFGDEDLKYLISSFPSGGVK